MGGINGVDHRRAMEFEREENGLRSCGSGFL